MATAPSARTCLDARQQRLVAVDVALQLGALEAKPRGIDEHRGIAGIDQGRLDLAQAGHVEHVDVVAGGERRTALAAFVVGRVEELQLDLGRREGHAVELEVAQLLHLAVAHRHVVHDLLLDVGLPDVDRRRPSAGASTRPMLMANGPTAALRLPQLPDQSTSGLSMATWPNR